MLRLITKLDKPLGNINYASYIPYLLSCACLLFAELISTNIGLCVLIAVQIFLFFKVEKLFKFADQSILILSLVWTCFKFFFPLQIWPFIMLVPIAGLFLVKTFTHKINIQIEINFGKVSFNLIALSLVILVLSVFGLVFWVKMFSPDIEIQKSLVPDLPVALLVLGMLAFSLMNAAMEEFIYRGVLLNIETTKLGQFLFINFIQSIVFASAHIMNGIPSGFEGFLLTMIYAYMLGWLRKQSAGLALPFMTHFGTDLAVAYILFFN